MILDKIKNLEIERVGDTESGIKAGITEESLPFIFELVSNQLYSNPIGSVVREITSNCFDAHKEIGVEEPIVIKLYYSADEGWQIKFQDFGVGVSPDRILNVYSNYFSSTKRLNNEQIGGFGIGSKTPLAYADMFYITTVFDGIKYEYIYHKGESKPELECQGGWQEDISYQENWHKVDENGDTVELMVPEIITIVTKTPIGTPTTERNGTIITINVEQNDLNKFKLELRDQLTYFDSIYFIGCSLENNYDIYEGQHFKYRSTIDQNYTEIHLCIGKVRYAIDFTKVKRVPKNKNIPVGIKFDIGELQVTPSRETIRYNEATIKLIEDRITLAIDELLNLYNSQNPEISDLRRFYELSNDTPKITFNAEKDHVLYLKNFEGVSRNYRFAPLSGLNIKKTPKNMFFMWECIDIIRGGKRVSKMKTSYVDETVDTNFILNNRYLIYNKRIDRISNYTDIYISENNHRDVYIIVRKEFHKEDYKEIGEKLGIKDANVKNSKEMGKARTIAGYIQVIDNIVRKNGNKYSDNKPSPEWVKAYQKSVKESSAAYKRRMNKTVFVRDMYIDKGITISEYDLLNRTGILIYGNREDKSVLSKIANTVHGCVPTIAKAIDKGERQKAFMVIQVSQAVEYTILVADKRGKKIIHWKDFFKTTFFKDLYTAAHIDKLKGYFSVTGTSIREEFFKDFEKDMQEVDSIIKRYFKKDTRNSWFNLWDYKPENLRPAILSVWEKFIKKHEFHVPLIDCISTYSLKKEDKVELIKYLKSKKIRLKNKYYIMEAPKKIEPPIPVPDDTDIPIPPEEDDIDLPIPPIEREDLDFDEDEDGFEHTEEEDPSFEDTERSEDMGNYQDYL